jgi:hypothetical protein
VEAAHAAGALLALRLIEPVPDEGAIARAAEAGFDLLVLDAGGDPELVEQLPALVQRARGAWRPGGWIAAVVVDQPAARAAVFGHAAQLARAGADLLWVTSRGDGHARLPAAPLADRLRNELGVATCIEIEAASLPDLDAAIAAGRADLVAVAEPPGEAHP